MRLEPEVVFAAVLVSGFLISLVLAIEVAVRVDSLNEACAEQCYPKFSIYEHDQCYCTEARQCENRTQYLPQPVAVPVPR